MAFAPDAVIFIPGSPLRTHDRHRSFVLACPLVSVWGSSTATLPRDVAVTSWLCRGQQHGSFFLGLPLQHVVW